MNQFIFPLLALISQWMTPRYDARLRFMQYQIQMLRDRIDTSRIVPTPEERTELVRLGEIYDHDIDELISFFPVVRRPARQLFTCCSSYPSNLFVFPSEYVWPFFCCSFFPLSFFPVSPITCSPCHLDIRLQIAIALHRNFPLRMPIVVQSFIKYTSEGRIRSSRRITPRMHSARIVHAMLRSLAKAHPKETAND